MVFFGFLSGFSSYNYGVYAEAGWGTMNFVGGFPRVFFGFLVGMIVQHLVNKRKDLILKVNMSFMHFFAARPVLIYIVTLGLFSVPFIGHGAVFLISVAVFCPLVVLAGALAKTGNRTLLRISEFLGWISYPVYCLHIPIGNLIALTGNEGGLYRLLPLPFPVVGSIIVIFVSIVMTLMYEQPVRALLSRHFVRRVERPLVTDSQAKAVTDIGY